MTLKLKAFIIRFWPLLRLRTILFGVLLFVAALPGFSAIFLRVYENALVRRTEAELIAQSAAIAAAAAVVWPGTRAPTVTLPGPQSGTAQAIVDVSTAIDLRASPILPERPRPAPLTAPLDVAALAAAQKLAPAIEETKGVTLSSIILLDQNGGLLNVPGRSGTYRKIPEVLSALKGMPLTVLRANTTYQRRTILEIFSRAANIRLHHARPIRVNGAVVGVVLVSRSPRALLRGMYEDRGKIAFGVGGIFILLIGLSAVLGRAIVRPLETLSAASRSLAKGTRQTPRGSALQVVEIRTLYQDFEAMADSIDQRSRYLRDFAASVSHEFKTPLAGLHGAIELLQDHGPTMTEAERAQFLDNMAADTGRLNHLVGRLLDLARADMHVVNTDARTDVVSALNVARDSLVVPAFQVTVLAADQPVYAAIDRQTLEAIFVTILENARQAGATQVDVSHQKSDGKLTIKLMNNGPPIPQADQARVFEPFFTSKRTSGGTGIGLSIAASLTRSYGGTLILAEGAPRVKFILELPLAVE